MKQWTGQAVQHHHDGLAEERQQRSDKVADQVHEQNRGNRR